MRVAGVTFPMSIACESRSERKLDAKGRGAQRKKERRLP
jgi:hypothetical protein